MGSGSQRTPYHGNESVSVYQNDHGHLPYTAVNNQGTLARRLRDPSQPMPSIPNPNMQFDNMGGANSMMHCQTLQDQHQYQFDNSYQDLPSPALMHSSTPSSAVSRRSSASFALENQLQELFTTCKNLQTQVESLAEQNDTLKETVNELQETVKWLEDKGPSTGKSSTNKGISNQHRKAKVHNRHKPWRF